MNIILFFNFFMLNFARADGKEYREGEGKKREIESDRKEKRREEKGHRIESKRKGQSNRMNRKGKCYGSSTIKIAFLLITFFLLLNSHPLPLVLYQLLVSKYTVLYLLIVIQHSTINNRIFIRKSYVAPNPSYRRGYA